MAESTPPHSDPSAASSNDAGSGGVADKQPRTRLLAGLKYLVWPTLCLFQFGLLAGFLFLWNHPGSTPQDAQEAVPPPTAKAEPGDLGRADDLLRLGRYELALEAYKPLRGDESAPDSTALQYRLALCLEGMGRCQQAIAAYRTLAGRSNLPCVQAAAQLGLARVYLRLRQPLEAKSLLGHLILQSAQPTIRDLPLFADAHYMLGFALTAEAWHADPPGPFNDSVVEPTDSELPVDRVLDWIVPGKEAGKANPEPGADALEVQKQGPTAGEIFVTATVRESAVSDLLDRLAEKSGLHSEWTAQARQQVDGRTAGLAVDKLPLSDVLRALADSLGLVWELHDETLAFSGEQEMSEQVLAAHRLTIARHALRDAALAYPGQPLTPAAYLELGNLDAAGNHLQEAAAWYQRLLKEAPRAAVAVEAWYNLGLTEQRLNDGDAARNAFYHVVDRAPAHQLAPLAYLKIGRMHLDDGRPDQAITPLRRALAASPGSSSQPAATVTLAVAYLLVDKPQAANAVLFEQRDQVNLERYHRLAAFLDCLARYRALAEHRRGQRESGDLLASLLALRDDALLGPSGLLLSGQAYAELGLGEQATAAYQKALGTARGTLANEVSYTLAESLFAADKREAAAKLLLSLAASDRTLWAVRARLRLAQAALQEKRPEECLTWCRQVLREGQPASEPAVLQLMGEAFALKGDHGQAARCFSGQKPE